jgi:hypothetical protein
LSERLPEFGGVYRVEPYLELVFALIEARDRVAIVNADDPKTELPRLPFVLGKRGLARL